jgi:nickel/cobalt exporter
VADVDIVELRVQALDDPDKCELDRIVKADAFITEHPRAANLVGLAIEHFQCFASGRQAAAAQFARWRIRNERGAHWHAEDVTVTTERPDGAKQAFAFANKGDYLESVDEILEPHEFMAPVSLGHGGHSHDFDLSFAEGHGHDHLYEDLQGLSVASDGYQDAHERAHANDIRRRFADQNVTTWQIALFGLTGGIIPCPAAITILLLCLQLKQIPLGAVLVLCFSIGSPSRW